MVVAGPTRVLSPHLLVAQAVAAALRSTGTAAEARSWESVMDESASLSGTRPAERCLLVVILDGLDRGRAVDDLARVVASGQTHVLIVTSRSGAVQWGGAADDDLLDITWVQSLPELADVVQHIRSGGTALDPADRRELRASWHQALERRRTARSLIDSLSPQQRAVLELLASGHRVKEVARIMEVTDGTVRSHVRVLRSKLGARTQIAAVAMLHQLGDPVSGVPRPRAAPPGDSGLGTRR
ncbi:response regulator transcription factor [Nocardioides glacieisoli]|uniref:Response regulator transcription factor n=1 Tax=Nocardioides glacieisoli TaxID=1168730 RepID=A0A4V1RKK4_9ACTN|nr:LuxR C-terminal-related transcriptional regulator [Nocardioides glacieisoli]RYB92592.1 response regulator transcription factor [Nocardioides glacieisoli]